MRKKEAEILERYDNDSEDGPDDDSMGVYDELEPIYIQMEDAESDIGSAYGPYMQNIALTHILCATAAEAHINIIAKGRLKGKFKNNFEKISLEGKWLFLPKILRKASFDQGAEPFQSFSKLIKYRNDLIHYKGREEDWEGFEYGKPEFLRKLGLSLRVGRKSLKTTAEMFIKLSQLINSNPPYWLRERYDGLPLDIVTNFFEVSIKR